MFDLEGKTSEWRIRQALDKGLDPGGLASLAKSLQFLPATSLTGLLVICLSAHLLTKPATFAEFAKASDRFLNRLAGTDP
jgi:hypothetical protein